jgi:hypothetical protein
MRGFVYQNQRARCFSLFLGLAFLAVAPVWAQVSRGGGQGEGAPAMGFAGAFTSIADDPSAIYWNPAGLAQIQQIEFMGMLSSLFNDKSRNTYFAMQYPTQDDIHLGFSFSSLYFTDLRGAHEDDWTGAVAIPVTKNRRWMLGSSFHYLYNDLKTPGGIGRGAGVDLGTLYLLPLPRNRQLRFGLSIDDLSTTIHFGNGVEQTVPRSYTPSIAFRYDPDTMVALDLNRVESKLVSNENNLRFRVGAERWFFNRRWALRAGYEKFTTLRGDIALGTSYETKRWSVDYAYMGHAQGLGNSHRISTTWKFNAPGVTPAVEEAPVDLEALVGDGKIHLHWKIPPKVRAEGYWVYFRTEDEKEYHRRRPEFLETDYCVLRAAQNDIKYRIYIRLVVDGRQGTPSNEVTATPRPILPIAKEFFDIGVKDLNEGKFEEGLSAARKAEEQDPTNIDVKELLRRLQKAQDEGLIKEKS